MSSRDATLRGVIPRAELHRADAEELLARLPEGSATLVYADPPFFTQRDFKTNSHARREHGEEEAFEDRWDDLEAYLSFVVGLARGARRVLRPEGSFVLHLDPKASHSAKVRCDEVFGRDAFASEIIWRYRRWPAKTRNFQRVHDVLLRWVRDPAATPVFHQLYEPLAESTRRIWGENKQLALFRDGKRTRSSTTDERSRGVPLGDVWEMPILAPISKERTGYPTQKPLALLSRLVEALTDAGDLVVDPVAGSGTALLAAAKLGRRAIGGDRGEVALRIAAARLGVEILDAPASG